MKTFLVVVALSFALSGVIRADDGEKPTEKPKEKAEKVTEKDEKSEKKGNILTRFFVGKVGSTVSDGLKQGSRKIKSGFKSDDDNKSDDKKPDDKK